MVGRPLDGTVRANPLQSSGREVLVPVHFEIVIFVFHIHLVHLDLVPRSLIDGAMLIAAIGVSGFPTRRPRAPRPLVQPSARTIISTPVSAAVRALGPAAVVLARRGWAATGARSVWIARSAKTRIVVVLLAVVIRDPITPLLRILTDLGECLCFELPHGKCAIFF